MNYVRLLIASLVAVLLCAGVLRAQQAPPLAHQWKWIEFPQLPALPDGSTAGVALFNNGSQGFALTFIFGVPAPPLQLEEANKMSVSLHLPDGTIVNPQPDPARGIVASGQTNFSYPFPWQKNVLEEAWIEMKVTGLTYWFEIPYGFTRDPAAPMTPAAEERSGRPVIASAMQAMSAEDRIVPWLYVYYDLGGVENGLSLAAEMANPFDANATVVLYKGDRQPWSLTSPTTSLTIAESNGRTLRSRCVNLHIHDDGFRRSDTFSFNRYGGGNDVRGWGTAHLALDGVDHTFVIPSSLFKYVHGTANPYSKAMVRRYYPYLNGITATNGLLN